MKNVFRLVKSKNSKIFSTLLNLFYVDNRKNFFRLLRFSHIKQIPKNEKIAFKITFGFKHIKKKIIKFFFLSKKIIKLSVIFAQGG